MTERIPSDHETVESHRLHLQPVGHTGRVQIPLPSALSCQEDDVVSISLAGDACFGLVERTVEDELVIRGAYGTRKLARSQDGSDELADWLDANGRSAGDPLLCDVLTTGYAYGLRLPGDRVVYSPPADPDSSLQSIAENLNSDSE